MGGGSNLRQDGQPTPKYPKNRKKTPDFGHFILESGGLTTPVFKSAGVRTPPPPDPPSATPLVGTDSQPCKMQILYDDSQACARPDQVFYQRYRARTRLRSPGRRSDVTKLTFAPHVSDTVSRANRALGLLIRSFQVDTSTSKFNQSAVLAAYFANVRSILEYCSVVWAGAANTHAVRVDRVLIWLLTHTSSGRAHSMSYGCLLLHFKIPSLASRRVQHDALFLRNIVRGKIDSPALPESFALHVPPRSTRTVSVFTVP